jgi:hypothetical protein
MIHSDDHVTSGKEVDFRLFVDSDHTGEHFTRGSRAGSVIYLNMAPICGSPSVIQLWSQVYKSRVCCNEEWD